MKKTVPLAFLFLLSAVPVFAETPRHYVVAKLGGFQSNSWYQFRFPPDAVNKGEVRDEPTANILPINIGQTQRFFGLDAVAHSFVGLLFTALKGLIKAHSLICSEKAGELLKGSSMLGRIHPGIMKTSLGNGIIPDNGIVRGFGNPASPCPADSRKGGS